MARRRRKKTPPPRAAPPASAPRLKPAWREAAAGALIVLATLAAYATALGAGYVWDDDGYLTRNPLLGSLGGLWRIWTTAQTPQYYPLVFTSFWIEHQLWGLAPFGYHLVNVALHAANALLAWRVLKRLGVPGAWLAGAIFALHPVHVESVAWVTERKNVLSGLFYLLALRQYLLFEEEERPRDWAWAFGLFVCALLSKSVTATLPAALLVLRWWRGAGVTPRSAALLLPFFAAGAASGALTAWLELFRVGAVGEDWALGPLGRLLLAGQVPWFYLGKLLWPAGLAFSYPRWEVAPGDPAHYLGLAGIALAALALWRWRGRLGRGPAAAGMFFLISLAPVLGFLNVYPMRYSWVADHFQYLASLGPIALAAAALAQAAGRWAGNPARRRAAAAAGAGLLVLLGALTLRQGRVYHDEESLWRDTIAKNPASWLAHNNLGRLRAARGRDREAIEHYRAALRARPEHPNALNNMGAALRRLGRDGEAETYFRRALAAAPGHPSARSNLGRLLVERGRRREGTDELRKTLARWPRFAPAHANLGQALMLEGKLKEAAEHFARALEADPGLAAARYNLGLLFAQARRYRRAAAVLREGHARHPGDRPTAQLLAWVLATAPLGEVRDGRAALAAAREAVAAGGASDPLALSALAAAYAELGRFEEAVRAGRRALRRAEAAGMREEADQIRDFLGHYERGMPYRSP